MAIKPNHLNVNLLKGYYGKSFWNRVKFGDTTEDCWEHQNSNTASRAGHVSLRLRKLGSNVHCYVHRIAWMLDNGDIPEDMLVLHDCHNPKCVNPNHLKLGTNRDNMIDAVNEGTHNFVGNEYWKRRIKP